MAVAANADSARYNVVFAGELEEHPELFVGSLVSVEGRLTSTEQGQALAQGDLSITLSEGDSRDAEFLDCLETLGGASGTIIGRLGEEYGISEFVAFFPSDDQQTACVVDSRVEMAFGPVDFSIFEEHDESAERR